MQKTRKDVIWNWAECISGILVLLGLAFNSTLFPSPYTSGAKWFLTAWLVLGLIYGFSLMRKQNERDRKERDRVKSMEEELERLRAKNWEENDGKI